MKQKSIVSKVAVDLFREQMKWSLWFLSFLVFAHIIHDVVVMAFGSAGRYSGRFFIIFLWVCQGVYACHWYYHSLLLPTFLCKSWRNEKRLL